MIGAGTDWFAARTAGAPAVLGRRAREYFDQAAGELVPRLATAGSDALSSAVANGADRAAALDLLAADALITLALLAAAEQSPETLGALARQLRTQASIDT